MFYRFFEKAFFIKKEEWALVHLFFAFFLCFGVFFTVTAITEASLFIDNVAQSDLPKLYPWIFFFFGLLAILLMASFRRLFARFSRISLVMGLPLFCAAIFLGFRLFIYFFSGSYSPYFLFVIWGEAVILVLSVLSYSFMGDYFAMRDARRIYGYIGGAMGVGAPLGGVLSDVYLSYFTAPSLLYFCTALLILLSLIALVIHKSFLPISLERLEKQRLPEILRRKIFSNRYLLLIFAGLTLSSLITCVVTVQWLYKISLTLEEAQVGKYLSKIFSLIGAAEFILTFVLARIMLNRFGVLKNLFYQPSLFVISSLAFILHPVLFFATVIRFVDPASLSGISREMLFLPLSKRMRIYSQSLGTGIFNPIGLCLGGLLLYALSFSNFIELYSVAIMLAAFLWIGTLILLRKGYKQALNDSLQHIENDPYDLQKVLLNRESDAVLLDIVKKQDAPKILTLLYSAPMETLTRNRALILELLKSQKSELIVVALQILAVKKEPKDRELITPFLEDKREEVASEAMVTLIKMDEDIKWARRFYPKVLITTYTHAGDAGKRLLFEKFSTLTDIEKAEVLIEVKEPRFEEDLLALLSHNDDEIVKLAIKATSGYPTAKILEKLLSLKKYHPFVARALKAFPETALPELEKKFRSGNTYEKYLLLVAMGKIGGLDLALETLLRPQSPELIVAAFHAIYELHQHHKISEKKLKSYRDAFIKKIFLLRVGVSESEDDLLLKEAYDFYITLLMLLLGIEFGFTRGKELGLIFARQDERFLSNSLELLENNLPRALFLRVRDLLAPVTFKSKKISQNTASKLLQEFTDPWIHMLVKQNLMEEHKYYKYLQLILFLKEVPLFKEIPSHFLLHCAESLQEESRFSGEMLFKENDVGEKLYIIVKGKVKIEKQGKEIAELGPKECLGELSLLDEAPRFADAKVTEDTIFLTLSKTDFHDLLDTYPEMSFSLLKILAQRVRNG